MCWQKKVRGGGFGGCRADPGFCRCHPSSRRARLHFCLSTVDGCELQPSWHCRAVGGCSRQQSCVWELLGSQGSAPAALAPRGVCSFRILLSSMCQRSFCVCYIPRDAVTLLTCVSLHRQNHRTQWLNLNTHTKALEAKGPMIWIETINILAYFLQEHYATKAFWN